MEPTESFITNVQQSKNETLLCHDIDHNNSFGLHSNSSLSCFTDSDQDKYPDTILAIFFTILSLILGIIGILCGSVVLLVMLCTKSTRTLSSAFLINLVCSDLLVCATVFPAVILDMKSAFSGKQKRVPDGVPCQLLGFLLGVFSYNSVLSISVIASDRYQAIVNCLEYTTYTTYKRVIRGLLFCWVQSIGWSIAPVFGWGSISYMESRFMCVSIPNYSQSYTTVLFLTQFIMPVIIMSVCYIQIVKIARRHARRICDINIQLQNRGHASHRNYNNPQIDPGGILAFALVDPVKRLSLFPEFVANQNGMVHHGDVHAVGAGHNVDVDYHSDGSNTSNMGTNLHKEARATVKLLGLILVFIFTWIPIHIINILSLRSEVNKIWESFAFLLACSNSCCNPVMYVLASKRFRHNLKRRLNFCFKFRKGTKKPTYSGDKRNKIAKQMASLYTNNKPTAGSQQDQNVDVSVIIHQLPSGSTSYSPRIIGIEATPIYLSQESLSKPEASTTAGGDISPRVIKKKRKKKRISKRLKHPKTAINTYIFQDTNQSNSNISLQRSNPLPPIGVKT